MSRVFRRTAAAVLLMTLFCAGALAGEGDPVLSVDELSTLDAGYRAFLDQMADLLIEKELLDTENRDLWMDAQMGDFYMNGGYGSLLIQYMPDMMNLVREDETLITLAYTEPSGKKLEISTTRRYSPMDSALAGLMLTLNVTDQSGSPADVSYTFSATDGVFMKWDTLSSGYSVIGTTAQSDGEAIVWSAQVPVRGAEDPVIHIGVEDMWTGEDLFSADLTLKIDGEGYAVSQDALQGSN